MNFSLSLFLSFSLFQGAIQLPLLLQATDSAIASIIGQSLPKGEFCIKIRLILLRSARLVEAHVTIVHAGEIRPVKRGTTATTKLSQSECQAHDTILCSISLFLTQP
jgi:hypothetical protein